MKSRRFSERIRTDFVGGLLFVPDGQEQFSNVPERVLEALVRKAAVGGEKEQPLQIDRLAVRLPQFEGGVKVDEQNELVQTKFIDEASPVEILHSLQIRLHFKISIVFKCLALSYSSTGSLISFSNSQLNFQSLRLKPILKSNVFYQVQTRFFLWKLLLHFIDLTER